MLHSTLSLFAVAITLTSSNRLLLQQFVAIPEPAATVGPPAAVSTGPPATTGNAQGPPAGVSTGPPITVPAATTVAPAIPAATVAQAPPAVTYYNPNKYNNQFNVPGSPVGPSGYGQPKLECKLPGNPMNPQSCAAKTMAFSNVNENFEVMCSAFEACTGAQMTFTWDQYASPQMDMFKKLSFDADFAAAGAVFTFSSLGPQIEIDEIKCVKNGSCQDAQFIIGDGVQLGHGDFFCDMNSCHGCTIKQGGPLAAAEPCWSYVDII